MELIAGEYVIREIIEPGWELTTPSENAAEVALRSGDVALGVDFGNVPEARVDFGDAPDPTYPTLLSSSGALHPILPGAPVLGELIDGEPDGQPTAAADGDDTDGTDDEDGVRFTTPVEIGNLAEYDVVNSGVAGLLNAWVDFNGDGDWFDSGEQIARNEPVPGGGATTSLSYTVPAGALAGETFARFRLSTEGQLSPAGPARDGEVEDMPIEIRVPDTTAPRVTEVLVRSGGWPQALLDRLRNDGLGVGGYSIPDGPDQLDPVPYPQLDLLLTRFDEDVIVSDGDLSVSGIAQPTYGVSLQSYDSLTRTAFWRLDTAPDIDALRLRLSDAVTDLAGNALDGEWADTIFGVSGDGTPGGVFLYRLNVVVADLDQNGTVGADDLQGVLSGFTQTVPIGDFTQADFTGPGSAPDATVGADELQAVLSRFTATLPSPAQATSLASGAPAGADDALDEVTPIDFSDRSDRLVEMIRSGERDGSFLEQWRRRVEAAR